LKIQEKNPLLLQNYKKLIYGFIVYKIVLNNMSKHRNAPSSEKLDIAIVDKN